MSDILGPPTEGVGTPPDTKQAAEKGEPEYAIENGWLVELVNDHTCGTAKDGYYGAHEPGCGMVPVARVEEVLTALANAAAWRTARVVPEPASPVKSSGEPIDLLATLQRSLDVAKEAHRG